MLSFKLQDEIKKNLEAKKQTILFLNRRGYSTFVMCRECGYVVKCKNCNISLTYHKYENKLRCHYCGYETYTINECPKCNSKKVKYFGGLRVGIDHAYRHWSHNASDITGAK